ncbi:MAG: GNAT family protein [Planctomycetota bacterium]
MASPILITGARVHLRHPVPEDAPAFIALRERNLGFHAPWEPAPEDLSGVTGSTVQARTPADDFRRFLDDSSGDTNQRHLICDRATGEMVGQVSLGQIFRGPLCSAYMGYWADERHTRRGLMRDGVRLCIRRAFEQLGLHRVEANIIPRNTRSRQLARACGLRLEGFSPRYLRIAGRWEDHERWALTREAWERVESEICSGSESKSGEGGSNSGRAAMERSGYIRFNK